MQKSDIYLVISIDTECDKGPGWIIQNPMKFKSVTDAFPNLLMPLFNRYNLVPTMLLSPEVIQDNDSVKILKSVDNCELGTHLHGEFIEPEEEWGANRTKTPQLFYNKGLETAKMERLTNLFREKFGYSPTSFRAGRFGVSEHTLKILEELGYTVDSSVSPFKTHYFQNGVAKNFWGAKITPYYPSHSDIRKKGKTRVLEVPVTILAKSVYRFPSFLLRFLETKMKYRRKVLAKLGYHHREQWLRPVRSSGEDMIELSKFIIENQVVKGPTVLNMMFHSNEALVGGSPYVNTPNELENFIKSLETLFDFLQQNYAVHGIGLSEVKGLY